MSEQFKAGDIAEGCNMIFDHANNGMECEILEGPSEYRIIHPAVGEQILHGYFVRWADGDESSVRAFNLRRRKPPTTGEESVLAMFKPATKREGAPA